MKVMYESNVGGLPIVDDEMRISAIVTEEDFVSLVAGMDVGIKVDAYMSPSVITAPAQTTIEKMTRMIIQNGFRRMPVVQDGVITGLVTASDIMKYMGSGEAFEKVVTGDISEVMAVPIKDLIKRNMVSLDAGRDLGQAAAIMTDNKIGARPIIDHGTLAGIPDGKGLHQGFGREQGCPLVKQVKLGWPLRSMSWRG